MTMQHIMTFCVAQITRQMTLLGPLKESYYFFSHFNKKQSLSLELLSCIRILYMYNDSISCTHIKR